MATINIAPPTAASGTSRCLHAKAYSQVLSDVLNDIVMSLTDAARLKQIFGWAFVQLKIVESAQSDWVEDVQICKEYFRFVSSRHTPYNEKSQQDYNLDLLIADAKQLIKVKNDYDKEIGPLCAEHPDEMGRCRKLMGQLFFYDGFRDGKALVREVDTGKFRWGEMQNDDVKGWGGHKYLKELNVRYCPYCNAETIYAITVRKDGENRPIKSALDHFIPHSEYPFFGISLCNLVPTCFRCNSQIKGRREVSLDEHAHPFIHDLYSGYRFKVRIENGSVERLSSLHEDVSFDLGIEKYKTPSDDRSVRLMRDFFDMSGVYNELFKPEARDIIRKIRLFTPAYCELIRNKHCQSINVTKALFGTDLRQEHITDYRLSKLTMDLKRQFTPRSLRERGS